MAVSELTVVQPMRRPPPRLGTRRPRIDKLVSGGQTGVDRAALDVALASGMPCGGWCPKGRLAEDGPIPARYPLTETPSADYAQRTEWNVRDSDATLVLLRGPARGGTRATVDFARVLGRPCRTVVLGRAPAVAATTVWLGRHNVRVLNVAGPRESARPGIYAEARAYLESLLGPGRAR